MAFTVGSPYPGFTVPHAGWPPRFVHGWPATPPMHFQSIVLLHAGTAASTGWRSARTASTSGERPIGSDGVAKSAGLPRRCTSTICCHGDGASHASKFGRCPSGSEINDCAVVPAASTVTETSPSCSASWVHAASSSAAHSSRTVGLLSVLSSIRPRIQSATTTRSTAAIAAPSRRTKGG